DHQRQCQGAEGAEAENQRLQPWVVHDQLQDGAIGQGKGGGGGGGGGGGDRQADHQVQPTERRTDLFNGITARFWPGVALYQCLTLAEPGPKRLTVVGQEVTLQTLGR